MFKIRSKNEHVKSIKKKKKNTYICQIPLTVGKLLLHANIVHNM